MTRYETVLRPADLLWPEWRDGQLAQIQAALDSIEGRASELRDRVDVGTIATGCALGYLDFRFPDLAWRTGRAEAASWFTRFSERPSMRATVPQVSTT